MNGMGVSKLGGVIGTCRVKISVALEPPIPKPPEPEEEGHCNDPEQQQRVFPAPVRAFDRSRSRVPFEPL